MVFEKEFQRYGFNDLVAYTAKDITDSMYEESLKIGDEFFGVEYTFRNTKLKEVIDNYGKFCFIIYDRAERQVIGYSYWAPIKLSVFQEFLQSKKMLLSIKTEYCSSFEEPVINLFSVGEAFVEGYDLDELHRAIEDIFQWKVLSLAKNGTKVGLIAIEAVNDFDEEYMRSLLGVKKSAKKENSIFYCDRYSPDTFFSRSIYVKQLKEYYK